MSHHATPRRRRRDPRRQERYPSLATRLLRVHTFGRAVSPKTIALRACVAVAAGLALWTGIDRYGPLALVVAIPALLVLRAVWIAVLTRR